MACSSIEVCDGPEGSLEVCTDVAATGQEAGRGREFPAAQTLPVSVHIGRYMLVIQHTPLLRSGLTALLRCFGLEWMLLNH